MKKWFFEISSVILIALSLYSIYKAPEVAREIDDTINSVSSSMQMFESINLDGEEDTPLFDLSEDNLNNDDILDSINIKEFYTRFITVASILTIVFCLVIISFAEKGTILGHKIRVALYYVFIMLFSITFLTFLISLISFIVILALKRKDEKDFPIKAEKVVPIEYEKPTKKGIIKALCLVILYALLHFGVLEVIIHFFPNAEEEMWFVILSIILDIIILIASIILYKKELHDGLVAIKSNPEGYRKYILKYVLIAYITLIIGNIIRLVATGNDFTQNQAGLNELPLLYVGSLAIFWAPFVEELIFRGSIRKFYNNKLLFIIVSGLLFGVLHASSEIGLKNVLFSALPYSALGICLATAYAKSNNIWVNILMHGINNFIAVCLMFMIFGL